MKSCPQRPQICSDENLFCLSAGTRIVPDTPEEQTKFNRCGSHNDLQYKCLLGIKQSRIFQILETDSAHFNEAEAGALMICLNSLSAVLDCDSEKKLAEINES